MTAAGRRRRLRRTRRGRGGLGSLIGGIADSVFGLGRRRRVRRRRVGRRRVRRGRGFFDLFKKGLSGVHNYVKSNNLISRFAPSILGRLGVSNSTAGKVGTIAKTLGYGRRRRRVRRVRRIRRGRGIGPSF
jgi:hypothetical protein